MIEAASIAERPPNPGGKGFARGGALGAYPQGRLGSRGWGRLLVGRRSPDQGSGGTRKRRDENHATASPTARRLRVPPGS